MGSFLIADQQLCFAVIPDVGFCPLLAHHTNGRAYASAASVCLSECNVAKRCVLEQQLLLTAYWKSYIRNWLVPKWMTFV